MPPDTRREYEAAISHGLFAHRLVERIDLGGPLAAADRELFERALRQMDEALRGQETVRSGRFGSRASESVAAYDRAISFAVASNLTSASGDVEKGFGELVQRIRDELKHTLDSGAIQQQKLKETRGYFDQLRRNSLQTAADSLPRGPVFGRARSAPS